MPAAILPVGAKILQVAVAFDDLIMRGVSREEAVLRLQRRSELDRDLVNALGELHPEGSKMELRKVSISRLNVGMIRQQDLRNRGTSRGCERARSNCCPSARMEHFAEARLIDDEVVALVPMQV